MTTARGWANDYGDVPRWWWTMRACRAEAALYEGETRRAQQLREMVASILPGDRGAARILADLERERARRFQPRPHPMRAVLLLAALGLR